jgi:hypothetical protein
MQIIDKIKWRFAALLDSLREGARPDDADNLESDTLSMVVRNLFLQDPVEYATRLIDGAEHEMLATSQSHQSCMSSRLEHLDKPSIQTLGGDISYSAQLAVMLFLTESATGEDTAV